MIETQTPKYLSTKCTLVGRLNSCDGNKFELFGRALSNDSHRPCRLGAFFVSLCMCLLKGKSVYYLNSRFLFIYNFDLYLIELMNTHKLLVDHIAFSAAAYSNPNSYSIDDLISYRSTELVVWCIRYMNTVENFMF